MKVNIYCPNCERYGRKKLLLKVERDATGMIYPYCKGCSEEIPINLDKIIRTEPMSR